MKRGQTCEHKFSECTGRQGQDGGVSAAGGTERSGVRRERRGPGGFESGQGAAQHGWNRSDMDRSAWKLGRDRA